MVMYSEVVLHLAHHAASCRARIMSARAAAVAVRSSALRETSAASARDLSSCSPAQTTQLCGDRPTVLLPHSHEAM